MEAATRTLRGTTTRWTLADAGETHRHQQPWFGSLFERAQGQGYADLNFPVSEIVGEGDFATAAYFAVSS